MKRLALAVLVVAVSAFACGGEEEKKPYVGGTGGGGGEEPGLAFAGIAQASFLSPDIAEIYWVPVAAEEPDSITYTIRMWSNRPGAGSEPTSTFPWTGSVADCGTRCRFRYNGLTPNDVRWFAVEAADAEGNVAGGDVVLPVVRATGAPTISGVSPASPEVGMVVSVQGENFLDERMSDDGLTLGGRPIEPDYVESWDNRTIRFLLPAGFGSGDLVVTTSAGSASFALTVSE